MRRACGEKLGGGRDGYELLKALGHTPCPSPRAGADNHRPGLSALAQRASRRTAPCAFSAAGASLAEARASCYSRRRASPAGFDLSRAVSAAGDAKLELEPDFLRDYCAEEAAPPGDWGQGRAGAGGPELFTGSVHNRLGRMLIKYSGIDAARPSPG